MSRANGWGIAVVVAGIVAVAALVIVLLFAGQNAESADSARLKPGDCIEEPADRVLPDTVLTVPCDYPHFGEVYAVLTIPDQKAYPGADALDAMGSECGSKFWDYAPDAPDGPTFRIALAYPTTESWAAGDRSLVCVAMTKHERSSSLRS